MANTRGRSARTGRFVGARSVRRSPKTTLQETMGGGSTGRHRSTITGKFISAAAAARHPNTSVRES
jgi:hypothetical protein